MQLDLLDNYISITNNSFVMSNSKTISTTDYYYSNDNINIDINSGSFYCEENISYKIYTKNGNTIYIQKYEFQFLNPQNYKNIEVIINSGEYQRLSNALTPEKDYLIRCIVDGRTEIITLPANTTKSIKEWINYMIDQINNIFNTNFWFYQNNLLQGHIQNLENHSITLNSINNRFIFINTGVGYLSSQPYKYYIDPINPTIIYLNNTNTGYFATTIQILNNSALCNYKVKTYPI